MNRASLIFKQKFISIIFIIIALAGSVFIYFYISSIKSSPSTDAFSNEVLIAKEEIGKGSEIKIEMIGKQKISKNIFSNNFISEIDEVVGKQTKDTILKGEIISGEKINGIDKSDNSSLKFSTYIPMFKKAATIPITYWGDVTLINIGDRIDVIATYYESEGGNLKSDIILSNKEIIIISGRQNQENKNQQENSGLSILNSGNVLSEESRTFYLTFYLSEEEIKTVFASIEKGNLNIAICSSKLSEKGSLINEYDSFLK
jgi:Flp pilus assembly protein CpaB